jgi:hypothetical protein
MGKNKMKYISTPNIRLKKKLSKKFIIYSIDEFRTSCINCKTEEENENLYIKDNKGVERKLHSVLTYQTESKRKGCINRDLNSVNNMIKIVNHFLNTKERLPIFRRSIKDSNPKDKTKASSGIKPIKVQLQE